MYLSYLLYARLVDTRYKRCPRQLVKQSLESQLHGMGRLQDRVSIVTGSSSGIGRAIALGFAEQGAIVVCADLSPDARGNAGDNDASATHEVIRERGGKAIYVRTDVTYAAEVEQLVQRTVGEFGRVDM